MADPMKKARAGERLRIPAAAYNAFIDATRWVQKHEAGDQAGATPAHRSAGIILAKNTSGDDRGRFDVLGIDQPVITPDGNVDEFKNKVALAGVVPLADPDIPENNHTGRFMILQEPLADEAVGRAVVAGVTPARVRVVTDTDRFADIDVGDCGQLKSVPWGSTRILWKESGLGVKWAVVRLGDRPKFAIFELAGTWQPGPPCQTMMSMDSSGEVDTTTIGGAHRWAKMDGCKPVFYLSDDCTYSATDLEAAQTIWHVAGYPPDQREPVLDLHERTGLFPAKFGQGDWVWCHYNEQEGRWQVLASYEDHWRFMLLTDLSRCGSALAQLVLYQDGQWCPVDLTFTVDDSVGLVCPDLCKTPASSNSAEGCACTAAASVPAGTYGVAKHYADSGKWEVLALGTGCCAPSSSESESESESESSSESESDSESESGSEDGSGSEAESSGGCQCPPGTVAVDVLKDQFIVQDLVTGCITVIKEYTSVCQPCDALVWAVTDTTCPSGSSESSGDSDSGSGDPINTCFTRYTRTKAGSGSGSDSGGSSESGSGSDSGSGSACYWRYTRTQASSAGSDSDSASDSGSGAEGMCFARYTRTQTPSSDGSDSESGSESDSSSDGTCFARYTRTRITPSASDSGSDSSSGVCYARYTRAWADGPDSDSGSQTP